MEYIIVRVSGKPDGQFNVLINEESSGKKTGEKIFLGEKGYVAIEVEGSGMKQKVVNVGNTTIYNPMVIEFLEDNQ